MLLAIDIGNTNIVCGVFGGKKLLGEWRIATDIQKTPDEYATLLQTLFKMQGISHKKIKGVILSSVVPPLTPFFSEVAGKYFHTEAIIVSHELDTGLVIRYDRPQEVGADRIVNAVAAYSLYRGPVIIVDFGTAITFCAVSGQGEYLGGAIAPGVLISAEALYRRTAKLPKVELVRPRTTIGTDTISSMQSGIIFGFAGLVDKMVTRITKEMGGNPFVIATGGLAPLIAPESLTISHVRLSLTLEGLQILYEKNRKERHKRMKNP